MEVIPTVLNGTVLQVGYKGMPWYPRGPVLENTPIPCVYLLCSFHLQRLFLGPPPEAHIFWNDCV